MRDRTVPGTAVERRPLSFESLFTVMLIEAFGFALILPVLPFLVLRHGASAEFGGILVASYALSAAVSGPIVGRLSDRWGRRTVMAATIAGTVVAHVLFALSDSLATLLLARVLAGLMGGNVSVALAAGADCTSPGERSRAMSRLMSAWALGFVIGPATGALIPVGHDSIGFWSGAIAAVASSVSFCAVLLLPAGRRLAAATDDVRMAAVHRGPLWSRFELLLLVGAIALSQSGLVSMVGYWAERVYSWNASQVSLLFFWVSICIVVAQLLLQPWLVRRVGDSTTFLIALGSLCAGCIALVINADSALLLIAAAPFVFCGTAVAHAMCVSFLSRLVPSANQGASMGMAGSSAALGRVVGPMACGALFARLDPVAPFWFAAVVMTLALAWVAGRHALAPAALSESDTA